MIRSTNIDYFCKSEQALQKKMEWVVPKGEVAVIRASVMNIYKIHDMLTIVHMVK